MSAAVKLPEKYARTLLRIASAPAWRDDPEVKPVVEALRWVLREKPVKQVAKPSGEKKPSRETTWKAIKAAVRKRSGGVCELCKVRVAVDPHHAFGGANRRSLESERSVIHVCRHCHDAIPTAPDFWRLAQLHHFERHGFADEAERMRTLMESRALRDAAEQAGKAVSR